MRGVQHLDVLLGVSLTGGAFDKRIVESRRQSCIFQCDKCKRIVSADIGYEDWCCTPCRVCRKHSGSDVHTNPPSFPSPFGIQSPLGVVHSYTNRVSFYKSLPTPKKHKTHVYAPERRVAKR